MELEENQRYKTSTSRLKLKNNQYELIKEMSHLSKNLYNFTLYTVKQHFFQTNKFLKYEKAYHEVKSNENYKLLPSQVAQQTMKTVDRSFRSFFGLLKKKKEGTYNRIANIPHYLKKDGHHVLLFTPNHIRINYETNKVKLTINKILKKKYNIKEFEVDLPHYLKEENKIKEIRIVPIYGGKFFKVQFVYLYEFDDEKFISNNNNYISIDLGIDNLLTVYDDKNKISKIIDGKYIKSVNRYFNKEIGRCKSLVEKINKQKTSKKIQNLYQKRNNIFQNAFHLISKRLLQYCDQNDIQKIVFGYNKEWKQNINIGKHNNQNFVQIPYRRLISYVEYKAEEYNIDVILQEESYTSKCDALMNEEVKKHEEYLGRRVSRGLFKSSNGSVLNADLNGAMNILRKCRLESHENEIESSGAVIVPTKIRLSDLKESKLFVE